MTETEAFKEFKQGLALLRDNYADRALAHMQRAAQLEKNNPYYMSYLGVVLARSEEKWAEFVTARSKCSGVRLKRLSTPKHGKGRLEKSRRPFLFSNSASSSWRFFLPILSESSDYLRCCGGGVNEYECCMPISISSLIPTPCRPFGRSSSRTTSARYSRLMAEGSREYGIVTNKRIPIS